MIWQTEHPSREDSQAFANHLLAEARAACGERLVPADRLAEAAGAVADYCRHAFGGFVVAPDCLKLLLARSLWGIGEEEAAERIVAQAACGAAVRVAALRSRGDAARMWKIASSRVVKPAGSASACGPHGWVVDLRPIGWGEDDRLELVVLRALCSLVDGVASAWDMTSGRGWLGLRGLDERAARAGKGSRRGRRARAFTREIADFCAGRLDMIGRERSWAARPLVVNLDL